MPLNIGYLTSNRENGEKYTPYYAVEPIIKYLPKNKIIWCPFDDPDWSAFSNLLSENGFNVISTCLNNGQDFFTYEPEKWDIIVSNPPFNLKVDVLNRLYYFNKPFAILLPLPSLQGQDSRFKCFMQGIQILSFDARINYHNPDSMNKTQNGISFATAYFCRDLLPRDLIIEKIRIYERPLLSNEVI